jgi:hypothetical protein
MATPTISQPRFSGSGAVTAERTDARADIGQLATYWLSIVAIYLIQGALWYYAAYEKIVGGDLKAPPGIQKAFAGSFVDSFPGTGFAWGVVSIAEAFIVIGLLASLIRMEFLQSRAKPILMASMAFSLLVLGALLFGQSMIGAHDSVASLFTYAAGTLVMMAAVVYLSPGSRSR